MCNLTLTPFAFIQALNTLEHYYGITMDYFPEEISLWANDPEKSSSVIAIDTGDSVPDFREGLSSLGIFPPDDHLNDALSLLTYLLKCNPSMTSESSKRELFRSMVERDLLRIKVFLSEIDPESPLTLKSGKKRTVLGNHSGWLWERMIEPFLEKEIPEVESAEKASSLLKAYRPGRGRRAKDARIPILLWGTFEMLSDAHSFETPMPDKLCDFLLQMLQVQGVVPESTDIDILWIRAELRYLRSKTVKPRFPITSFPGIQSSIMKGAQ